MNKQSHNLTNTSNNKIYPSLRALLNLFLSNITLLQYIEEALPSSKDLIILKLSDLPKYAQKHEKAHSDEWNKIGIKTYYVIENGYPSTIPDKVSLITYVKKHNISKKEFRKLILNVVTAPEKLGISLGSTDEWMKRILNEEFKTLEEFALNFGISIY